MTCESVRGTGSIWTAYSLMHSKWFHIHFAIDASLGLILLLVDGVSKKFLF